MLLDHLDLLKITVVYDLNKTSQGDAIETFGLKIAGLADAFVEMFHHKECTKYHQVIRFDKKVHP